MRKIRLTESQVKRLQEIEKDKLTKIKISESQAKRLKDLIGGKAVEETVITENFVEYTEFGKAVIQFIGELANNPSQSGLSPFWVKMGVTKGDLFTLLTSYGILSVTILASGEKVYKLVRKGVTNAMKRLYNVLKERRYDMYDNGKVINKENSLEEDNSPVGSDFDPNNPENISRRNSQNIPSINKPSAPKKTMVLVLLDNEGDVIGLKEYHDSKFREVWLEKLSSKGRVVDVTNSDFINYTKESRNSGISFGQLYDQNNSETSLEETMTTGTAGAISYETPKFLSKDPNNGALFNDPMIKGGKIVKDLKEMNEGQSVNRYAVEMDMFIHGSSEEEAMMNARTISKLINRKFDADARVIKIKEMNFGKASSNESEVTEPRVTESKLKKKVVTEALKLRHNSSTNKLVVISDLEDQRSASKETFVSKNILKSSGFGWDGSNWSIDSSKLEYAKKALTQANKVEYLVDQLEDLEQVIAASKEDEGGSKNLLKSKIEQYIMDLANATDEASVSGEIKRYLSFFSKFTNHSFNNAMLIYIQNPNATRVAGFRQWEEKFKRKVVKGAKAIKILAPMFNSKNKDAEIDDDDSKTLSGYRVVNVFDIADTKPIDGSGEIPDVPEWFGQNEPSEIAEQLFSSLSIVADTLNIKLTFDDSGRGEKGYSAGDHINLSSDVSGAARVSTMVHEMAHELMHWKKSSLYYIGDEIRQSKDAKALMELQAESVSYTVLKHYNLPVSHHPTYLALWKANKEKIQQNLQIISKVSSFIIKEIEKNIKTVN